MATLETQKRPQEGGFRFRLVPANDSLVPPNHSLFPANDSLAAANNKQTKENNAKISAEAQTKEICPPAGAPSVPPYFSFASTRQRKSITAHTKTAGNRGLTSEKRLLALPIGRFSIKASSEISGKESPQQKKSEQSIWQTKNSFYLCTRLTAIR
jgi:hypothetical protein